MIFDHVFEIDELFTRSTTKGVIGKTCWKIAEDDLYPHTIALNYSFIENYTKCVITLWSPII